MLLLFGFMFFEETIVKCLFETFVCSCFEVLLYIDRV